MCAYGIELLEDNVAECRANTLQIFADYLNLQELDDLYRAAEHVLADNIVHGDALKMLTEAGEPITFAEWGYLRKVQRRDFRYDNLVQTSSFGEDTLFAELGKHEIFTPVKSYAPTFYDRRNARIAVGREHEIR
jgi:hypothetical protein